MRKIIIWTLSVLALSSFVFASEDMVMCTMDYNPVCWVDWKTYGNTCWAWAAKVEVAYKWECSLDNVSLVDEKTKNIIDTNVNNIFKTRDDLYLFARLSNYIWKTVEEQKSLLAVILMTPDQSQKFHTYLASLEYLNKVLSDKIIWSAQTKVTKYVNNNLSWIVLNKEQLGGKFYTTNIDFSEVKISQDNKVVWSISVEYEDWHNFFTDRFSFEYLKDKIKLTALSDLFTIKKWEKFTLSDGSILSIKSFINSPCPTWATCIWAWQQVTLEINQNWKISEFSLQPWGSYELWNYNLSLKDSDYTTFVSLKLESK